MSTAILIKMGLFHWDVKNKWHGNHSRISAERMFLQHEGMKFSNQSLWYLPGIRTPFSGGASLWCNHGHVRPGPEKILMIPLSCFAHVEIELYCHDSFIKIQHDDKSHYINLAWTCISLESHFLDVLEAGRVCKWYDAVPYPLYIGTWVRTRVIFTLYWDDVHVIWRGVISFVHRNLGSDEGHFSFNWDDVQVIWRCVISFVHRNLGSDEGHFYFILGWCASDMTLCHILCTPEPGFGRGSFLLYIGMMCKWYDAVSYPLYTGTWVRTRVIFTLYLDDVQVIWRCVISFVRPYLGSDEGHFYFILGWCASDMTLCHILCTPVPGFGRGSISFKIFVGSQDSGVQVICRCVISLVRPDGHTSVQTYDPIIWQWFRGARCHFKTP